MAMSARPDNRLRRLWQTTPSPFLPRHSLLDYHDDWNLIALGALNAAQVGWWCGLFGSGALNALFVADAAYLIADTCWLIFAPSCVPVKARGTLLMHHCLICFVLPVAAGKPVLMRHLLRTWIVELHSWTHIATRRLRSKRLSALAHGVNKPFFFVIRLVAFPITYLSYSRERAALPSELMLAHAPLRVHALLSLAHFSLYGLMLKWGWGLLLSSGSSS